MSNNADDQKDDTEAPDQVEFAVMKNPHVIIIGICDYDAPNHALPAVQDDIRKMKELWKTKFKYPHVSIIGEDTGKITRKKLASFLNDESSKIQLTKQVDGLIIVYSGHGANDGQGENYIVGSNNDRLALTTIQEKFDCEKCDYLKGKPKLLYFDCCRGEEKIENEEIKQLAKGNAAKKQYINNLSDFMMHYATSQNYISWSNQKKGGHLINAIYTCYTHDINKHKTNAITLHETSMKLNQMVGISNKGKQTAEIVNRLTYDVYIKPFKENDESDVVASRPVLMRMLTDATKKSQDYPALKAKYEELQQSFTDLTGKETEYKNEIETLKTAQRQLTTKLSRFESKISDHDESDVNFMQEIESLTDRNNELQERNTELKQQFDDLKEEMENININHPSPVPPPPPIDPIPEPPDNIGPAQNSLTEFESVDTWQDKDVINWNCLELQSWIQSLGLENDNGEVDDLLIAINRTDINGKEFRKLNNGQDIHNKFLEDGFSIDANTAAQIAEQLPRKRFVINKPMLAWTCDELQEWVMTLNISDGHKQLVRHSIVEMQCTGEELASVESVQDILDSFDEINRNVAKVIFDGIKEMKAYY